MPRMKPDGFIRFTPGGRVEYFTYEGTTYRVWDNNPPCGARWWARWCSLDQGHDGLHWDEAAQIFFQPGEE